MSAAASCYLTINSIHYCGCVKKKTIGPDASRFRTAADTRADRSQIDYRNVHAFTTVSLLDVALTRHDLIARESSLTKYIYRYSFAS